MAEPADASAAPAAAPIPDEQIVVHLPDGIAVLDSGGRVLWANARFGQWCGGCAVVGRPFFACLGLTATPDGEAQRFSAAVAAGGPASGTLRAADGRYFDLQASAGFPVAGDRRVVVAVRDVTHTILEQQKRAAIHAAGQKLADLSPAELADMTVAERIELLKSNILHYSKDLLQFDVVEIRLLDRQTGRLEPLLAEGMQPAAEARILYARPERNGVTGYVAATGRSYWCSDTTKDPLYLEGCKGAKSSLTVPLMLHDQVIGTFNVESPEPNGFTETDLSSSKSSPATSPRLSTRWNCSSRRRRRRPPRASRRSTGQWRCPWTTSSTTPSASWSGTSATTPTWWSGCSGFCGTPATSSR